MLIGSQPSASCEVVALLDHELNRLRRFGQPLQPLLVLLLLLATRGSGEDMEGTPVASLDARNAEGALQSGAQALG